MYSRNILTHTKSTLICTVLYCCVLRNVLSLLGAGGTYRHSEQTADGNDQRSGEREKERVRKSDRDEERTRERMIERERKRERERERERERQAEIEAESDRER